MKAAIIMSVLCFLVPKAIIACSCYETASFSLLSYDRSWNVAEVRILERGKSDYENRLIHYQKDTSNWDKLYPPPPIIPIDEYTEFKIEVIEVFKGSIDRKIKLLRAKGKNSSCYWEPKVGARYIFYMGQTEVEKGGEVLQLEGCQRVLNANSESFSSEKDILKSLKEKKNGKFVGNQKELLKNKTEAYISISGRFKNGKREGAWVLSEPVDNGMSNTQLRSKNVLILSYRDGDLIDLKYSTPYDKHMEYFTRQWKFYYEEKLLPATE